LLVAVYGGSFNPPHVAHAMVAGWILWTSRAEQVWLVPVFRHAFEGRQDKSLAPFERRVRWCEALAQDVDRARVVVSRIEAHLSTPSFTVATLEALRTRHPEHTFRLVVGADVASQTTQWKEWDRIEAEFDPILVGRAGHPSGPDTLVFPDVSSTEVRRRLAASEPVDHLVTARVWELLREHEPSAGGPRGVGAP
jgi:nicotinate-nucleotide adenylyltransferase